MPRPSAPQNPRRSRPDREPSWSGASDAELLGLRLCDLELSIEGSPLAELVEEVRAELRAVGLAFRPRFWLSTDWFAPDGVPGAAIPFFLAHPRLARLERKQVLEVEGGTRASCLALLRHESAHALDSAFRLHRRRDWRETFGRYGDPYPRFYRPRPQSRAHVQHITPWYAQAHPAEDWAETFATWLDPRSRWRERYAGWEALAKLEYVEQLVAELAGRRPSVKNRERTEHLGSLQTTLGEHYERKRRLLGDPRPHLEDGVLRSLFAPVGRVARPSAATWITRRRPRLRREVAASTGEAPYALDLTLREAAARASELGLRLARDDRETERGLAIALTTATMNFLHDGHHRLAR